MKIDALIETLEGFDYFELSKKEAWI